jgi:hypothetical protein
VSIFGKIVHAIFGSSHTDPDPVTRAQVNEMLAKRALGTGVRDNYWKTSIVDLLKLLDVDSSLEARKELAAELDYTGRLDGSERMNTWLHEAVMKKLCETGGKVPDSFKD